MPFCPRCGSGAPPHALYCFRCGAMMRRSRTEPPVVCRACGTSWPSDTAFCPKDGTRLKETTA